MKNFAPKGLSLESRKLWNGIVSAFEMDHSGLALLKEACLALDRLREAQAILGKDGITVTDRFGQLRQHPATLIERDARNQMLKCLAALHLDCDPEATVGAPIGRF